MVLALGVLLGTLSRVHAQEPPTFAPKTAPKNLTTLEDLGIGDTAALGARISKEFSSPGPATTNWATTTRSSSTSRTRTYWTPSGP